MKIKQIAWDKEYHGTCFSANCIPQMLYMIRGRGEQFELRFFHGHVPDKQSETEHLGYLASMDGAKRTAQSHFEKYITANYLV